MSMREVADFMVKMALAEDVGRGDLTTRAIIAKDQKAKAVITAKADGVICGLDVAADVFRHVEPRVRFKAKVSDGAKVKKGKVIAELTGPARGLLTGERVALNFLQHLSGIATLTNEFVVRAGRRVKLLDTRKTVPGLRALEKYAVRCGGGTNHRIGLYDAVLIKDNHIKLAGGIVPAIKSAKAELPGKKIEAETKTLGEVREAIASGADRILLDNMSLRTMTEAVKLCKKAGVKTEASGGINLNNVAAVARTGVDFISVGALTHSAKALDINLKIV